MPAAAIGAPIIGGLLGADVAGSANSEAKRLRDQALSQYQGINPPTLEEQQLNLLSPEYIGNYQAQQEGAIGEGPSAMEGVSTDPRLQQAQMAALQQLSDIGQAGMTPAEAAALRTARRASAGEAQAKSSQITQEMARRGMGGSGAELAAQLQNAQSSADRQSQASDQEMQAAQARALQALSQTGSLSGQIQNQQFNQQSDIARAKDAINQFNTQNQQNVQQRNVAATNQAALRNLQEQQRIGEAGAAVKNVQQQANKGLLQTQFNNQLGLAGAKAGQYQNSAAATQQAGANLGQMYAGVGNGVGTGIAALNDNDVSFADFGE